MRKFKPTRNQNFFMLNSRWEIMQTFHTGSMRSQGRINAGNAFRTREDAELFKKHVMDTQQSLTRPWWRFW